MQALKSKRNKLSAAVSAAAVALSFGSFVHAQDETDAAQDEQSSEMKIQISNPAEEVLVLGRLQTSAATILEERINQPFSADILDSEMMLKVGDPDLASALRRVTGLTLVGGKYIYIRGLGERYSSTLLNGAVVPSPELTRNVIPLDLLPTSIVESVKVQKAYSPNMPGHFGGGNINIRTKTAPEELAFSFGVSTGINSLSSDDGLSYNSGGDEDGLPGEIAAAINTYQGDIGVQNIFTINDTDGVRTPEELTAAAQINREILVALNRDIEITPKSLGPDIGVKASLGNSWDLGNDWTIGAQASYSYDNKWRNVDQIRRGVGNPSTTITEVDRTVEEVKEVGGLSFGIGYGVDHEIDALIYSIKNTDDEAQMAAGFDNNNTRADGTQTLQYGTQFEERNMLVAQILGEHAFNIGFSDFLQSLDVDWFYSDATAKTDIPNQTTVQASNDINPDTLEVISTQISKTDSAARFEFLELEDQVESYGWNAKIPFIADGFYGEFSGGFSHSRKAREYYGYSVNINFGSTIPDSVVVGTPGSVFTDSNILDLNNSIEGTLGTGLGNESYIAAQMIDAGYGMFDITMADTWRLTAGARWENYRQAVMPLDLLDFTGETLENFADELEDPEQRFAISEDDIYPAAAVTYINEGLMGTETFQVRLGYGKTVVRPELRELSDVQYLDPEYNVRVQGNPLLEFSDIDHIDLRTEWFYDESNYTVSLFYKDVANPIETSRTSASDDNILLEYYNAVSGKIAGIELEAYTSLGAGFFVSGNLTLSDSEIVSPEGRNFTNVKRSMTGHSDVVFNTNIGFDSENGQHSASLVFNYFSERVYYAARNDGHDDAMEQPFSSLDLVYSYYPTDRLTVKLNFKNILDQAKEFEQVNSSGETAKILEQDVGTDYKLSVTYSF